MITLAELALNSQDKLVQGFINELLTDSYLLSAMPFDDCLSSNGQSDLVYAYKRVTSPASASFRALNSEGTPSEPGIARVVTNVGILNSVFEMDRVSVAAASELLEVRLGEAKNAIIRKFNSQGIVGKKSSDENAYDGLDVALTGSSTEVKSALDLSTVDLMKTNALAFSNEMDTMLSNLDGDPGAIIVGRAMKVKLNTLAKALGINQLIQDDAGKTIDNWGGIPIVRLTDGALTSNDIYAVRFGLDGFHGITLSGGNAISVHEPDFTQAGAVHKGDAEFVCGVALKATKAAGVLRAKTVSAG